MNTKLFYCFGTNFSSAPKRLVFALEKPAFEPEKGKESQEKDKPKNEGVPIDVDKQKSGPEVLRNEELFKVPYTKTTPNAPEPPEQRAPYRFLNWLHQQEYELLPDAQRETYLKAHDQEIQSNFIRAKEDWGKLSPALKVPRLRPSLIDRPELMVDTPVYALGGNISRGIAEKFRGAKVNYVPGGDPLTVLQNFEELVVKGTPPEKLKEASVVLTFDRELLASQSTTYIEDTRKLVTRLNQLGLKITAFSPMKTHLSNKMMDPEEERVWQRKIDFWDALCKLKMEGLISSVVDFGDATMSNNTFGTSEMFLQESGTHKLNDRGIEMAVNGAIMGINAAHGYDGGQFSNDRMWPGGKDYALGKTTMEGKPVEAQVAGAPLVDKSLRDAALDKVKPKDPLDALRRIDTDLIAPEVLTASQEDLYETYKDRDFIKGMSIYRNPAKLAIYEGFQLVQREKAAGKDVTELAQEFSRLASSIYIKLARVSIIQTRRLFEDPKDFGYRKDAFQHTTDMIHDAVEANGFYHFFDANLAGVQKEWDEFKEKWDKPGQIPTSFSALAG